MLVVFDHPGRHPYSRPGAHVNGRNLTEVLEELKAMALDVRLKERQVTQVGRGSEQFRLAVNGYGLTGGSCGSWEG